MAREELSWPPLSRVVAQDGVDVFERGDRSFVGPACHQQRLLSIFNRSRKRAEVGKHGCSIILGPMLLVVRITPTHPASRKPIPTLKARDRAADALTRDLVGVEVGQPGF